jgi:HK97 family phage portal protein
MRIFPELRRSVKDFFSDNGGPISLGLPTERKDADYTTQYLAQEALWYASEGYTRIAEALLGGLPSYSGEVVGLEKALTHPVVWACVSLISKMVGAIPSLLYQRIPGKGIFEAPAHPIYEAMKNEPNAEISARGFTELLTSHCLVQGDGLAKIVRRSGTGTALELHSLLPTQVQIDREKQGQKRLVYTILNENGAKDADYPLTPGKPHEILHLRPFSPDGIRGYSVLKLARNSIGSALAADRHIGTFWANGGRMPYWLEHPTDFRDEEAAKEWRSKFEKRMSRSNTPPIVTNGIKLHEIGSTMRDAQGIENRNFVISEICRWFNISPTLVGELSRATFNNHEQYMLQFVRMTLQDWLTCWEQDFRRCVLTPEEKAAGYFLRHDIRELLRGDFQTQMQGFATGLQNGYFNQDEVRDQMGLNPLPDEAGSHYHIQLNMQTLPEGGAPQTSRSLVRLDRTQGGNSNA